MMNAILVKTRVKIASGKQKLRGINPLITTSSYSEAGAGLVAESVL
jgi:hypothetical protein